MTEDVTIPWRRPLSCSSTTCSKEMLPKASGRNMIFFIKFSYHAAAAAAAKSLQSCLTLCNPIDGSPPGSPVPGILQARILEWGAITFSTQHKGLVKLESSSMRSAQEEKICIFLPLELGLYFCLMF